MKKTQIHVQGMHCNSCKLLLEQSLASLENVQGVHADVSKGTVTIDHTGDIDTNYIKKIIKQNGYRPVDAKVSFPRLSQNSNDYKILGLSLVVFLLIYWFLRHLGMLSGDIVSADTPSLGLVVLIGLTAGFSSCMAVVGGLILAVSSTWNKTDQNMKFTQKIVPHLRFNIGRILGFALLGGILGTFGSMIHLSPVMMSVMTLLVGVVMLLLGINLTDISPKLKTIQLHLPTNTFFKKTPKTSPFISGVLSFFLPCGFTFAMQLYAINTGNFWMGMAIMGLFALGTLPGLIGVASLASFFKGKIAQVAFKVIGVLVVLLGIYNISNSYSVVTTNLTKQDVVSSQIPTETISIIYTEQGMQPSIITLSVGKTYTILIDAQTTVYGCMSTIYIPGLDDNIQSIKKGNQISFVVSPKKAGTYSFDCAMGLPHNAKIIVK